MSADEDIKDLLDEFALLDEWEERYRHVIAMGESLDPLPEGGRNDANRVRGCVSQVWLSTEPGEGDRIVFRADSDAHIVRGLAAILLRMYSNRTPRKILEIDAEAAFTLLGLDEHLSPQRSNGLRAMVQRIRAIAQAALSAGPDGRP